MFTASARNWPFSRVGVSRNCHCEQTRAERMASSKTAVSVGSEQANVAARERSTSVCCSTAAMDPEPSASPGSSTWRYRKPRYVNGANAWAPSRWTYSKERSVSCVPSVRETSPPSAR